MCTISLSLTFVLISIPTLRLPCCHRAASTIDASNKMAYLKTNYSSDVASYTARHKLRTAKFLTSVASLPGTHCSRRPQFVKPNAWWPLALPRFNFCQHFTLLDSCALPEPRNERSTGNAHYSCVVDILAATCRQPPSSADQPTQSMFQQSCQASMRVQAPTSRKLKTNA